MTRPHPIPPAPDLSYRDLTDQEVAEAIKDVDESRTASAEEVRQRLLNGIAKRRDKSSH
ncbi:hypothetical protein [Rhodospirillum sp. A1_3_36]|uniref:hypothetical protein n=1 Tax=Rhodospirillum sp. A1_3_36 TaxID=3391666 RepID=UPI0039A52459